MDHFDDVEPNLKKNVTIFQGGMCRLFASLASSDCPPGTVTHPFGIENIWKFLVGTVLGKYFNLIID